jgi:peptidoglycan hydrolase-like protein with peptidoglycan-binding domain
VNNSGITGMTMTYDSISAKKSGSVAQNEESIKGFQYANLLKGSLLYDISIKNLQIHITKADGTDFESFKINTKSPVSIATIYSSGTDAAGPENTIGLSNKYFSNFDADAKVDIDRDIDRDKNLPMLVLGSLDEDKVMKPGNNIEVIINTEDTTPEFNGTWNAFPFLLDYNF